jgi:hypothetical protein
MSIIMDFTTPAVIRPDIINLTYKSFSKNLKGVDLKQCRLFINVDPLPEGAIKKGVIKIARKYFKEVHYNYAKVGNFTAACNWIWSHADTPFIFHLEDDWELVREISVKKMLKYFDKHSDLLQVVLRAYRYPYRSVALSPGIMHERLYKAVAGKLRENKNPESQMRGEKYGIRMPARSLKILNRGLVAVYPEKLKAVVVRDRGRKWLDASAYKKPRCSKTNFISWQKK